MFEKAIRNKLRFKTSKGLLSVEDLWDLNLPTLDSLAKELRRFIRLVEEDSFISSSSPEQDSLNLQFDIVKHIIDVKLAEEKLKKDEVEKRAYKKKIAQIIAEKKDENLKNLSLEELSKLYND